MMDADVVSFNITTTNGGGGWTCPCPEDIANAFFGRFLEEGGSNEPTSSPTNAVSLAPGEDAALWETIVTTLVLVGMFVALVSDRVGADSVMLVALALFMVTDIITIKEGLEGFANEGVLTVMILFVVAEGISKTGALDWYMTKLLGRPKTVAGAQLRLILPIVFVSAFLNNTPVVAIMIPIVLRWSKNIGMPVQQLMMPLSFASILGGTCTLIGTSTNLVISGMLQSRYGDNPDVNVGIFDLGIYGVPIALVGTLYIIIASRWTLPGGGGKATGATPDMASEDVLLGAKLMPWSPAAGRSVKRSGLRNTGGIYLVSVHRAATGNVHRAVGQDFVLNVGDVLYFTGLVEGFDEFCEEHGMAVLTHDGNNTVTVIAQQGTIATDKGKAGGAEAVEITSSDAQASLRPIEEDHKYDDSLPVSEIGVTKESLMNADDDERSRSITRMIDLIRGIAREEPTTEEDHILHLASPKKKNQPTKAGAHKVVVTSDYNNVIVGVDAMDRPGLLLDISKGLLRLNLTLRHSEASVVADRSISIWRCEVIDADLPDLEEIWSVMNTLLESTGGEAAQNLKRKGTPVIRALVTPTSSLNGKTSMDVDFRNVYKAAIIAVQKGGRNVPLGGLAFSSGDVMILQANIDSPLLRRPPPDFYKAKKSGGAVPIDVEAGLLSDEEIWRDLQVMFPNQEQRGGAGGGTREFLGAMQVAPKSKLAGKTASESGLDKFPGVFLVSIDRPTGTSALRSCVATDGHSASPDVEADATSLPTVDQNFITVSPDTLLEEGDVLWFAGDASSVGDLRKIPGLVSFENEEVEKINEAVHDRRLVEAVIARRGPLVGKTVKQVQFRTRYGAAVIAVHRDGSRIHEHPGRIKLQSGDVLLLEAGPTFIKGVGDSDKAFSLLAEVKNSAPPRLRLLIPALFITVVMLGLATSRTESLLVLALFASFIMVAMGILTQQEARDSVNWEVYVTIACAFGIGTALVNSGVAGSVAGFLVKVGSSFGSGFTGLYGAVYLATFLVSNVVTNNAAAALIFPIAMDAAEQVGADLVIMAYSVMLGASASFMSPFGYQTNLMVYGPGGYKTTDFVKIGTPMQIILWVVTTALLGTTNRSNFWLSWVASFAALVIGAAFMLTNPVAWFGSQSKNETVTAAPSGHSDSSPKK